MKSYYEKNGITIYCGDCLKIMPKLDMIYDAVITDPPYGIGYKYDIHDDNLDNYPDFMKDFLKMAEAITVDNAPFFVWQSMLNAPIWHTWFPEQFRIFAACKGFIQIRAIPIQYSWDPIIFWGNIKRNLEVYKRDYHEQKIAQFGSGRERISHPCPRPLQQVQYILSVASAKGDIILDPLMGAGTTLIAAQNRGQRATGIEISEEYCKVAVERLRQPSFFSLPAEPKTVMKQLSLEDK